MVPSGPQRLVMAQLMRHNGAMDVSPFAERLAREFATLARIDNEDADAAARLESAIRLTLSDVLAAAADEAGRDPAPGSGVPDAEEDATARISVRISRQLKAASEQAAGREGRSVDAWLGQLASAAVQQGSAPGAACRRGKRGRQRYTAWVR